MAPLYGLQVQKTAPIDALGCYPSVSCPFVAAIGRSDRQAAIMWARLGDGTEGYGRSAIRGHRTIHGRSRGRCNEPFERHAQSRRMRLCTARHIVGRQNPCGRSEERQLAWPPRMPKRTRTSNELPGSRKILCESRESRGADRMWILSTRQTVPRSFRWRANVSKFLEDHELTPVPSVARYQLRNLREA